MGLALKSPPRANHVFTREKELKKKAVTARARTRARLFLISSPHMDSSRFREINRMLSKNFFCMQLFPLSLQTNVNKKKKGIITEAAVRGGTALDSNEILPQRSGLIVFANRRH